MEEIYALAREAFIGGQDSFQVHAFPFRMTAANMARHAKSEWYPFWKTLKEGHDYFELTRQVPTVAVCNRRYVVNVSMAPADAAKLNPAAACPAFHRPAPEPVQPQARRAGRPSTTSSRRDPKCDRRQTSSSDTPRSGLTKAVVSSPAWWNRMLSSFGRPFSK